MEDEKIKAKRELAAQRHKEKIAQWRRDVRKKIESNRSAKSSGGCGCGRRG